MKKHLHTLDAGIYPFKIVLSSGFNYDELCKELKKQKCDLWLTGLKDDKKFIDSGRNFALKRRIDGGKHNGSILFYIIFRDQFRFTDYWYMKLAHEILHICQFMLPEVLERDREYESEAYLHSHIMGQALKKFRGK